MYQQDLHQTVMENDYLRGLYVGIKKLITSEYIIAGATDLSCPNSLSGLGWNNKRWSEAANRNLCLMLKAEDLAGRSMK